MALGDAKGSLDDTRGNIIDQTNSMDQRSTDKLTELNQYMEDLIAAGNFVLDPIDPLTATTLNLQAGNVLAPGPPNKPNARITQLQQRTSEEPPTDFTVDIDDVSFPSAPAFNATLDQPTIPDAPTFVIQTPADKPDITDPRALPSNITDDRPATFTVGNYNVPSPNAITIPDFTEDIPANTLVPPTQQFNYVEPVFALTLKDDITTKLNNDVNNGGTGLDSDIEDAIFDRAEERDKLVLEDTIQAIIDEWSGRGFSLPTGILQKQIEKARLEHDNNRLTTNRDIQKLQADLAQTNTHFAIDKGLNLVQQEFLYAHQVNERTLQSERSLIEFSIALWNTKVTDHNLKLERVRVQAVKNASIFQGEGLRLEAYKNELLELGAKSTLDKDKIANYTAQVNSFNAKIGLFGEQVRAVNVSTGVEDLKIRFYESQTRDFVSRVNAENAKFTSHSATVDGELGRVKVFAAQVDAYVAEVTGTKMEADIQVARLGRNIESENIRLKAYVAAIGQWKDKVALAVSEMGFESSMFGKEIDKFSAEVAQYTAQAQLDLKTSEMGQRLDIENLKLTAIVAQSNLEAQISAAQLKLGAKEAALSSFTGLLVSMLGAIQSVLTVEGKAEITEAATLPSA